MGNDDQNLVHKRCTLNNEKHGANDKLDMYNNTMMYMENFERESSLVVATKENNFHFFKTKKMSIEVFLLFFITNPFEYYFLFQYEEFRQHLAAE